MNVQPLSISSENELGNVLNLARNIGIAIPRAESKFWL